MADERSMTTQEVVRRTLLDEHGDFLKEAVAMVAAQLMDAEISGQVGAGHGEVSAERVTHRNGYRPRSWETRVGEIELQIPRKRSGESYFPSFLEPRRRCEQAIVSVVMEAYVNGVSTRSPPTAPSGTAAAIHRARLATRRAGLNAPDQSREFSRSHLGNSRDR